MEEAIRFFIKNEVKRGQYFDSHTVIEYLIQNHTNDYLQEAGGRNTAETYHGRIAQIIDRLVDENNNRVVSDEGIAVSKNIRDKFSECHLWRKN